MRIAIIGRGIAANAILFQLTKLNSLRGQKITHVEIFCEDQFFPSASIFSTANAFLNGTTRGHSDLGNLLVESFEYLYSLSLNQSLKGINPAYSYKAIKKNELDFQSNKRFIHLSFDQEVTNNFLLSKYFNENYQIYFENGFVFEPLKLFSSIESVAKEYFSNMDINFKITQSVVTNIDQTPNEVTLYFYDSSSKKFDFCFSTTGAFRDLNGIGDDSIDLKKGKVVSGSYLLINKMDYGQRSWHLQIDKVSLLYRHCTRQILLGNSTVESGHLLEADGAIEAFSLLVNLGILKKEAINDAIIEGGYRHKLSRRMPHYSLGTFGNVGYLHGLYKNGYLLSWLLSDRLIKLINKGHH